MKYKIDDIVYVKSIYRDCCEKNHTIWGQALITGTRKRNNKLEYEVEYVPPIYGYDNEWVKEEDIITDREYCIKAIKQSIRYFQRILTNLSKEV